MGSEGLIYPTGMYPNSWEIEITTVSDKHLLDKDPMFLAITSLPLITEEIRSGRFILSVLVATILNISQSVSLILLKDLSRRIPALSATSTCTNSSKLSI